MSYKSPIVVAEIGCNHKGDFEIAKELILLAKQCGAEYAKFQKRNPKEMLSEEDYLKPHVNVYHAYGNTYGAHREFLEFDIEQHKALKEYCDEIGIKYACSAWDITSARELISINPDYIKVPSACNNHEDLLEVLYNEYDGQVHISLGMTSRDDEETMMDRLDTLRLGRTVLYACTSAYPVDFSNTYILEVDRIKNEYGSDLAAIGFSGHHLGIAIDVAAYTLGAQWVERHFTKDRTWKGTDHAASLEPSGLSKLIRDLNASHLALKEKPTHILDIEQEAYNKLKFKK